MLHLSAVDHCLEILRNTGLFQVFLYMLCAGRAGYCQFAVLAFQIIQQFLQPWFYRKSFFFLNLCSYRAVGFCKLIKGECFSVLVFEILPASFQVQADGLCNPVTQRLISQARACRVPGTLDNPLCIKHESIHVKDHCL